MKKQLPEQTTAPQRQQARVLGGFTLDGIEYQSNDIIEADAEIIKSLGNSIDASTEAVDECMKLGSPVKQHECAKN